jgi:hypothetical protein
MQSKLAGRDVIRVTEAVRLAALLQDGDVDRVRVVYIGKYLTMSLHSAGARQ